MKPFRWTWSSCVGVTLDEHALNHVFHHLCCTHPLHADPKIPIVVVVVVVVVRCGYLCMH